MLKIIDRYLTGFVTQVLLFSVLIFTGCASSNIETVDSNSLMKKHNEISRIFSFKLKDDRTFNDNSHTIYLNFANSSEPQIIYNGPAVDSLANNITGSLFQSFSLLDVSSAVVEFKKKNNPLPILLGVTAALAIVALIFLANGNRNTRTTN